MSSAASGSLFERVGGQEAVASLVTAFYQRVLVDPELSPFFEGASIEKLQRMQAEFFSAALGGPIRYTGRPLSEVHQGMGIRPRHLARFVEHMLATLRGLEIGEDDALDIISRINRYADEITGDYGVDG